jgi:hypothetical protein
MMPMPRSYLEVRFCGFKNSTMGSNEEMFYEKFK